MAPKLKYKKYDVLTRVFLPPFKKKQDFEKESEEFIKHFRKLEKEVLRLIEEFTGFEWKIKKVPIYLVPDGRIISVSKKNLEKGNPGVLQRVYGTHERSTHILIHELVHINQFQSEFWSDKNRFVFDKNGKKNTINLEVCTDITCLFIIRKIFGKNSKYEKDWWHFLDKVMTSTPGKGKEIRKYLKKWDLNKKPLRGYILRR